MRKIKILLADDHQFLLEGIKTYLNQDINFEIIGMVNNGRKLMDMLLIESPDLLILDLNMPGEDGFSCLERVKGAYPKLKVIVYSNYNNPEFARKAQDLGADGFLPKSIGIEDFRDALLRIMQEEKLYQIDMHHNSEEGSVYVDGFLQKYQLTKREVEIIRLIVKGHTTKEIAEILFLSEFTISTHRKNILRKLSIKSLNALIAFAHENRIHE